MVEVVAHETHEEEQAVDGTVKTDGIREPELPRNRFTSLLECAM